MPNPVSKIELPPLDEMGEDERFGATLQGQLGCRERQLLAKMTELDAALARIAELEKTAKSLTEEIIAVIEAEPELPGPMPKEHRALAESFGLELTARAAVIATKKSIIRNVRAWLAKCQPITLEAVNE